MSLNTTREKFEEQLSTKKGRVIFLILAAIIFLSLIVLRRPDAVTYPQFLSEDEVWFSNAYSATNPIMPFLHPMQDYFQSVGRIGAYASLFFGLANAPLVMNIFAIFIEALPAFFFLSRRFEKMVPKLWQRFLIGLVYLTLPGTFETHANITNSQWRLAILSFLIIVALPSKKTWEKIFDYIFLVIGGLSGPFVFFLFPILIIHRYFSEYKKRTAQLAVVAATFLIQVWAAVGTTLGFYTKDVRVSAPLGASIIVFFKLIAGKLFVAGTFGLSRYLEIKSTDIWKNGTLPILIGVVGIFLWGYVLWKASLEVRLFVLLVTLVLAAALISPQTSTSARWVNLLNERTGNRYFFLPIVGWSISLIWLTFKSPNKQIKYFAGALLACMIFIGVPNDLQFPKFKNLHYQQQISEFGKLPSGQQYIFKTAPDWTMTLTKK